MDNDCVFCKIAAGIIPTVKILDSDQVCAFRDLNPQAPVHVLVIPKKHFPTLAEMASEPALLGELTSAAVGLAGELGLAENGYRLVLNCRDHGGQTVYHVHMHLLGGRMMRWPPG